jgi:hypothetical protein
MPYEVILTGSACKTYHKLPLHLRIALDKCIILLENNPRHGQHIKN